MVTKEKEYNLFDIHKSLSDLDRAVLLKIASMYTFFEHAKYLEHSFLSRTLVNEFEQETLKVFIINEFEFDTNRCFFLEKKNYFQTYSECQS